MSTAAATIVASLLLTSCSVVGSAPQEGAASAMVFTLRIGESALSGDGSLRIGFEDVTADSRCPKGERCVSAGDAVVRVWLQPRSGQREVRELHVTPAARQSARVLSHEVRLIRLDPYPVTGSVVARENYVLTLRLDRVAPVEPPR